MEEERFEQWAVLELFGHNRIAGLVTETQIGGVTFMRVDVPQVKDGAKAFTRFFNPSAVYAIDPVTEAIAREMAKRIDTRPIMAWDIGYDPQRSLPYQEGEDRFDEE